MALFGRKKRDGVRGTARVISTSHPPHATHGSLRMNLVVEAPGIAAFSHAYSKFAVRVDKWPSPGDVLPVEVDPGDPQRVEVLWDEIPRAGDMARQEAEQLAAALRQQQQAGDSPTGPTNPTGLAGQDAVAGIVGQLQQMFPGAVVNVEAGSAAGPTPEPTAPPPVHVVADQSDADPVERLEKLARLRDAGIVDQAQFEQLKAQILGQAGLDRP